MKMKNRTDRTGIRTFLFFVCLGTIPFYLLGIGLWLFAPEPGATDRPGQEATGAADSLDGEPTWTPLNSGGSGGDGSITPVIATGFPTLTIPPTLDFDFGQPTAPGFPLFTPIGGGGGQATFVVGTPVFISSPTPIPTRFITATFTLTPVATNTSPAPPPTSIPPTAPPQPTTPPLIPPTDTPGA